MGDDFLVRDDILTPAQADELEKLMFGAYFPWYYLDNTTTKQGLKTWLEIECPMYVHNLYFEGSVNNPGYKQILAAFGFNPDILIRMKANMMMPRPLEFRHTPYHVDRLDTHYTIVYYVNDTEGATILKSRRGLTRVQPKKGRIVMFDGSLMHANYLPSRRPRCVINFNFRAYPLPGEVAFPASVVTYRPPQQVSPP
jgi:hypothetical protein